MKIVFTGGGSGGHFYPIIAVAEAINEIVAQEKLLPPQLYYIGPEPYDERALFENGIEFRRSPAGKVRRYHSWKNFFDGIKTFFGAFRAIIQLYSIFPDVVFAKGGYASFPTVFAARILGIPVIVHESDATVGRANRFAAKFAKKIAVSYPRTVKEFPGKDNVALTGNPIRKSVATRQTSGASEYLNLEPDVPTILVLGGSQGAQIINETLLDALPALLERYQIIHQAGEANIAEVESLAEVALASNPNASRYHPFGTLNTLAMRMAAGAASLVVSRAGSGAIFEIAAWGLPSIIIPIPVDISHDQSRNAFAYAQTGAAVVIEQNNLSPHLLTSEINRLMEDKEEQERMKRAAAAFAKPEAARTVAEGVLATALAHER